MTDKYEQFNVDGGYTFGGSPGTFEGEFRIFPDGKLVGLMFDEGRDIFLSTGQAKMVVGLANQNDRMNFWKLAEHSSLAPLVYTLGKKLDMGKPINGEYQGVWAPIQIPTRALIEGVEGMQGFTQVGEAFSLEGIEAKLDALADISKEVIQGYFDPNMIQSILDYSQDKGHLSLSKK